MNHLPKVVLFLSLQIAANGVEYGPSISSLTGVFVNWRGPDLLAIESGRKVRLSNYPGLSATLPLISGYSSATSEQIFKERGISTVGEFVVQAPKGYGIIAVIQELKLRKTTRERGNPNATVSCSDYIQIGATGAGDGGKVAAPEKICGTVLRDDVNLKPSGLLGPRSFQTPTGQVTVTFNHAYVTELVYSLLGSKQKHILKAELTFTAYKDCSEDGGETNSTSSSDNAQETYQSCSDYKLSSNLTCISSKLTCDDVYNCGGDSETLGSDDNSESCPDRPVRTTTEAVISPEDNIDAEEKQGLSDLSTYLGIPSLSSYTPRSYERKFRPSYVSGSSGSGFLSDYAANNKRQFERSSTTTIQPSPLGGSIEINVVGPTRETKTSNILINAQDTPSSEFDSEIYSRRELAHAINSVIYGVAVFIIFTIFITVFVVCLTKKIQTTWTARQVRRHRASVVEQEEANSQRHSVQNVGIRSSIINTLSPPASADGNESRRVSAAACDLGVYNPVDVIIDELDSSSPSCDLPPAYDSLFPTDRT